MTGRERVRRFLQGDDTDRPPFVPFVTDLAARLAQISSRDLFGDPQELTGSLLKTASVCELDCVVLNVGAEVVGGAALGGDPGSERGLAVVREAIHRLRTLLGDRAGIVAVLPGPFELARHQGRTPSDGDLEDLAASLLSIAGHLDPPSLDVLGVLESGPIGVDLADRLAGALSALWNVARYYSMPSLFVAAEGDAAVGRVGATAVMAWHGVEPSTLEGGARVGVPVPSGTALDGGRPSLPPRPSGGFYTTEGEVAATTEVAWMQAVSRAAGAVGAHG